MWDARVPRGTAVLQAGLCATLSLQAPCPGDTEMAAERGKNRVMDTLEDRIYARQSCRCTQRRSLGTGMRKGKEQLGHTHPDAPHGRHDLHAAVWPRHIQAPDVLQGKKGD